MIGAFWFLTVVCVYALVSVALVRSVVKATGDRARFS